MLTDCGYMILEGQEPTLYSFESFEEVEFSLIESFSSFVEVRSVSLVGSKGEVKVCRVMKGCSLAMRGVHRVSLSSRKSPLRKSTKASIEFISISWMFT